MEIDEIGVDAKMTERDNLQSRAGRLTGLDLFRLFAVLMIFFFHTGHIGCSYGILQNFVSMGAMFMTAFFMLSGFVLYLVYRGGDFHNALWIGNFYLKRAIAILPIYWLVALMYTICSIISGESLLDNLVLAPIEISGLQSVFCSVFEISHNGGTWFVSCILFCYFIFPYIVMLVKQLSLKCRRVIAIGVILVLLYSPLVVGYLRLDSIYSNPFFRMLEFTLGILLCEIWQDIRGKTFYCQYIASPVAIAIEAALLIVGVSVARWLKIPSVNYMLYSWIGVPVFTFMILGLAGIPFKKLEGSGIIKYCVEISYVFFFAQFFTWPICRYLFGLFHMAEGIATVIKAPVSFVVCMVLTVLLHELLEKPISKSLKEKLRKRLR